ncbi:MAG: glycosyltransferase family 4 protein [Anaerolineae bacterium]|nr:glycosyltransferase family 4 protein [Gemmatimonadaceae bacterium]
MRFWRITPPTEHERKLWLQSRREKKTHRMKTTAARAISSHAPAVASSRILLAGAVPGEAAGNAVSSALLQSALSRLGEVGQLSHEITAIPRYREVTNGGTRHIRLGTQPFSVHGEALLAGRFFRGRLSGWSCGWAVNSRYAGALMTAGVPYVIWEATTFRDELDATDIAAVRRAGTGSGLGAMLHRSLLPLGERIEGTLYRRAAALVAMSEHTRERIIATHSMPASAVGILTHPPTPAFLEALERSPSRRAGSGERQTCRLLFVGRVDDPRKNYPLLQETLRLLSGKGIDFRLTVVGPHTQQWRRSIKAGAEADYVTYTGLVDMDALAAAYLAHDVLVVSSRQEGFGIVVAESMHAGLPVVSTRCGGPEHIIRESGGGILADHTPRAMAQAIEALALDTALRSAMSDRAREYAARRLSLASFYSRVEEITRGVLDGAA